MKTRSVVLWLALMLPGGGVQGQSIGGYASMDATQCVLAVPAGTSGTFYVLAVLTGAAASGITGAELRIIGLPPSWLATVTPNPAANYKWGNPLDGEGAQIGFPTCRTESPVLLYTIEVQHTGDTGTFGLAVTRRTNPSSPNFACALVTLCDPPVFTKLCVATSLLYLNTSHGQEFSAPRLLFPEDRATAVPLDVRLSWQPAERRSCFNHPFASHCVFLGTDPDPAETACDPTPYWGAFNPGLLQPSTTYYWRIVANESVSSPVWSFTTGNTVAVGRKSWSAMKRLYLQ